MNSVQKFDQRTEEKMAIKSGYSINPNIEEAVKEIKQQITINDPRLIVFFASSIYNQEQIAKLMKESFNKADVIGCSTSGEIASGKVLNNSVVAMGFDKQNVEDVKVEVIENIKNDADPQSVLNSFEKYYNENLSDMDIQKYFGLVLIDGLSNSEEKLMDKIGTKINVNFIGGSAGDDLKFQETNVYCNGKCYTNAAVLALVKSGSEFAILKTQSFKPLEKCFVATQVDEANREIFQLDGKPAVDVYAEAVNNSHESISEAFMTNPIGVMVGDEPFVRSPQQVTANGIKFYCNVVEGTELRLLQSTDIVRDTKNDLNNKLAEIGNISGIINFNCILRTLELQSKNKTEAYGKIFSDIPTIGFSTYGEEYIGHINQTAVLLLLK